MRVFQGFVFAWLLALTSPVSWGALRVNGFDPAQHDRFSNSSQFIGQAHDWSGIGQTSDGRWGTLISPSYAITATHLPPEVGSVLSFFTGNDASATPQTRQVVAATQMSNSDLTLLRLNAPTEGLAQYPIHQMASFNAFINQEIFVWGLAATTPLSSSQRLGRNVITDVFPAFSAAPLGPNVSDVFIFDFDPVNGLGADEARGEGGDSGAPSFVIGADGLPAVVGLHWFVYDPIDFATGLQGTGDTLVASYVNDLNNQMRLDFQAGFTSNLEQVRAVPEPSTTGLLACLLAANCFRRHRRTKF